MLCIVLILKPYPSSSKKRKMDKKMIIKKSKIISQSKKTKQKQVSNLQATTKKASEIKKGKVRKYPKAQKQTKNNNNNIQAETQSLSHFTFAHNAPEIETLVPAHRHAGRRPGQRDNPEEIL